VSSHRREERERKFAVGMYKQHLEGLTVRQLAELHDKPVSWVSKRLKIGERFFTPLPHADREA